MGRLAYWLAAKVIPLLWKIGAIKPLARLLASLKAAPVVWKIGLLVALGVGIGSVITVGVVYQVTKKPITRLPGVQVIQAITRTTPPRYLFSIYNLARPMGVAVTPEGDRIYVTEADGERMVRVFDRSGKPLGAFAPPSTSPTDRVPVYLAIDPQGKVYVSDRLRGVIDIFSPTGEYLGKFTPSDAQPLPAPLGVAFDQAGNLLVTDILQGQHRIIAFGPDGSRRLEVGKEGPGAGEFAFPNAIVVDSQGRIFVADSNNVRVQVFEQDGGYLGTFGRGELALPRGMVIDDLSRLYVVDTFGHEVRVYDISKGVNPLFTFGSAGPGDGEFYYPNGIAIDRTDRLYVTDRENGRVQVWVY